MDIDAGGRTRRQRLVEELKQYVGISLYLYVCFGSVLLYKAAVLDAEGVSYAPYGLAAVKALVLGKFMLLAHELRVGERFSDVPLAYVIAYRSLVFLAVLVALTLVEEIVAGVIRGRTATESLAAVAGGTWMEIAAASLLLWLILVPYFAFRELSDALGPCTLRRMLLRGAV